MTDSTVNLTYNVGDKAFIDNPTGRRVLYGIVGILSVSCNAALCAVVLKNNKMLKNSYNVLALVLAVVDTVTGIFIIFSPSFVIGNEAMPIPAGPTARAFCFLIQRNFFVWLLAKISVFIVMCMAVERWYALVRPMRYKIVFTPPRVILYVTMLSGIVLIVTIPALFQTFAETKGRQIVCVDKPLMGSILASQVFTVLYCAITAFVPFMVIIATFIHLQFHIMGDKLLPQTHAQKRRQKVEFMLSRMSAFVALVLMICVFPSQITFILFTFNLTNWDVVNISSTLSMFNSVFNPWIYCLTNKVYRKEFAKLIRFGCRNQRETSASSASYERKETASASL